MKVLKNLVNGEMKLCATTPNDFYILSSILKPNDKIESFTTRKVSFDGGKTQQKISCVLEIKIESIDVDLEEGILYCKGKISKEQEHVSMGVYHTLHIPLEHTFKINKSDWTSYDLKSIKEANKIEPEFCFVVFYDTDCVVSILSGGNLRIVSKHDPKAKSFKNIINGLKVLKKIKCFIFASVTGIAKEFYKIATKEIKDLSNNSIFILLTNEYKNLSNQKTVNRIVMDKNYSKEFSDVKYVEDLKEIEKFYFQLERSDPLVFVGMTEFKEAIEYGALKVLFITDEFYRPRTLPERKRTEAILKDANDLRAKICIIPVSNEFGEKLKSMGNISGFLLFNYK